MHLNRRIINRQILALKARQRGAVLYVALIMLILLALIGISAMQVAGMQEKMASNYRAVNRSFQQAEGVVRNAEASVEAVSNRTALPTGNVVSSGDIKRGCDDGFDPVLWAQQQTSNKAVNVRQIDQCIQGEASIGMGQALDSASPIFQITGIAVDDETNASSRSAVDTVFKL
ncbi:pilus assembly protein [Xanthomonas melonis]|uniref:Pilus assembly protein n=1 Tax=Xanthomonas melonis TaxID=56456 RepID=A0ABS8NUR8_9XANT|nr:PilX N-terminal domain-containing pilus assembly protein [Xanthomonas melonis]MCD0247860.1 pilus assembly protein [Xanthomonas melonis]MCD0256789.1 pilus assembly protein [Xanthomonas melonis]MCD0266718.1 pilus assembly protein [Xanthomonas melonis]MCD0280180.1 pilus assembly protein [Xanthomonas melonis]